MVGHVIYDDPLLIHLAGNCTSMNVRKMLAKSGAPHLAGELFHQGVEAHQTAVTYPSTFLQ